MTRVAARGAIRRRTWLAGRRLAATVVLAAASVSAFAQWPQRPVTVITNAAPGGQSDIVARVIAQSLKDRLGQGVTVDNRPGANNTIAAQTGARAQPDGYTLLFMGVGSQLPIFSRNNAIDIGKTMVPVAGAYSTPMYVFVRSSLGVNSLRELLAWSQSNDLKLGVSASTSELALAMLKARMPGGEAFKWRPVRYRSDVAIAVAMLSGEIDFSFSSAGAFLPHLKAGTVKPLLVATPTKSPLLPETPTTQDLGLKDFVVTFDIGLWAPKGTPPEVLKRLQDEITSVVRSPDYGERLRAIGSEAWPATGAQQLELYEERVRFWTDAARLTQFQPE